MSSPCLIVATVAGLAACAPAVSPPAGDPGQCQARRSPDDLLVLERTACHGDCPVYSVAIHRDGSVIYKGEMSVNARGEVRDTVPQAAVDALFAEASCAGASTWRTEYRTPITDHPSAKVTLKLGSAAPITIEDYPPCHDAEPAADAPATPPELCKLEQAIDRTANTSRWTVCLAADGSKTTCPR
jgi:hypothetical protein